MLDPLVAGGIAVAALLLGAGGAWFAVRNRKPAEAPFDSARAHEELRRAETHGQDLIERARRDAEQIVREADLRARDEAVRRREDVNREVDGMRNEIREIERRAEKREDAAEQKHKELDRKERHTESLQKKLAE